ncbi:hypothetical protein LTR70_008042 [Exophiala xenobiotica]|uniref:Uncharacterized protein n=1 Tax=Lithohypha guttulata TaxID=1690604 RepID=A0ABR0K2K3_9EURO|nr:hypothetical protein LTR24_007582 [Lithohypha guttulata]KAK5312672.1 hypothetical protein LTR70_008042 [Exophiala xenobiotica]
MAFLRRKSGVYHDDVYQEDFEPQRRRRLSKPLTNSSHTNLASLSTQQMTRPKSRGKAAHETSAPVTPASPNESREALRTFLFMSTSEVDMVTPKSKRASVAMMTARFDKNNAQASTSQLSLVSPTLPQRPMSHMQSTRRALDSHMSSVSSLASKEKYGDADFGTVSPTSSTEDISQNPAPRARRTASFTPGIATRAVSLPRGIINEELESAVSDADAATFQELVKERSGTNSEESSFTTPQNDRSGTPTDLEYPNIGRMGVGSLRVINGASSPAPSELSRLSKLLFVPLKRDNSSVYPESEIGTVKSRKSVKDLREEGALPSSTADDAGITKPDVYRSFSFGSGTEARFSYPQANAGTSRTPANSSDVIEEEDQTKMLAEDYMAALPTSPFAAASRPTSHVIVRTTAQTKPDSLTPSALLDAVLDSHGASLSPVSYGIAASTALSQGSVRRHADEPHSRCSFADETLGSSYTLDRPGSSSTTSFFSVPETDSEPDERFKSTVELQPARPRSKSPRKHLQSSPLRQALMQNNPQPGSSNLITDSGYSSNNTSSSAIPPSAGSGVAGNVEHTPQNQERHEPRFPFRTAAQRLGKPLLVEPTPSTKIPSPISAQIESASAMTSTTSFDAAVNWLSTTPALPLPLPSTAGAEPIGDESALVPLNSPPKAQEKQRKKLQKLRRKSTADAAGALVIQRLASVECFNIPAVSSTARSALAQRSEAIPELERTFKTQDHTTRDRNASNLSLALVLQNQILRFPSPEPVNEQREGRSRAQSRSRKRSLSRPRTWFGRSKDEEDVPKQKPMHSEPSKISLSDLGSVADLLGDNPYDMARAKPRTATTPSPWDGRPELVQRRTSPSNITTRTPRPKSMMDDETASQLSKARRIASANRNEPPASRESFEDRGRSPNQIPRQARMSMDGASRSRPRSILSDDTASKLSKARTTSVDRNRSPASRVSFDHQGHDPDRDPHLACASVDDAPPRRPRSMMDDHTASKLSKARRAASTERHQRSASRTSFDDRGGIPGKIPHQAHLSMDEAPPLPPMPSPDEINRRFSYRHGHPSRTSQLAYGNVQCSEPIAVDRPDDAPPPPPHSPRPSYVDNENPKEPGNPSYEALAPRRCSPDHATVRDDGQHEHAVKDGEAPLPPCHSPRPMDVTHEERRTASRKVSWSSQANAWRARKQSANAAFKESWDQPEQPAVPMLQQSPRNDGFVHAAQRCTTVSSQEYLKLSDVRWQNDTYQEQHYPPHGWYPNRPGYFHDTSHAQPYHDYDYEDDQYYQDQYSQAGPDNYVYANNTLHPLSHQDHNYQQQPLSRSSYDASQPSLHPRDTSHMSHFSPNFHQKYPTHDAPQPYLQRRSHTYDDASRPTSRHSHHSRSLSRPLNISRHSRKSLSEELHPLFFDVPPLPSQMSQTQSPHIGR